MAQRSLLPHFHDLFIRQTLFHRSIRGVHRITCLVQSGLRIDGDNEMSIIVRFAIEDMGLYKRLNPHLPITELLFSLAATILLMVCSLRPRRCAN
jgi:hypothetical protein